MKGNPIAMVNRRLIAHGQQRRYFTDIPDFLDPRHGGIWQDAAIRADDPLTIGGRGGVRVDVRGEAGGGCGVHAG